MQGYTHREIEKRLRECGYEKKRQKGSHAIWVKAGNTIALPVRVKRVIGNKIMKELDREFIVS